MPNHKNHQDIIADEPLENEFNTREAILDGGYVNLHTGLLRVPK